MIFGPERMMCWRGICRRFDDDGHEWGMAVGEERAVVHGHQPELKRIAPSQDHDDRIIDARKPWTLLLRCVRFPLPPVLYKVHQRHLIAVSEELPRQISCPVHHHHSLDSILLTLLPL